MAASAMTPKLLGRISNEKYQEKDNWKKDDIALGPANELLISGHSLYKPEAFISMYKEDSGKYGNRPEFNRNFCQPHPGKQVVLFLEGGSTIGLKIDCALRLFTVDDVGVSKTLWWKRSPTCVCLYRGELYSASSSSTKVSVCNLDLEEKSEIILSDMRSDRVLEMVVVMDKIYVCTKFAGQALVFSMTGSKEMEFKNAIQTDVMATSICINERTELVFVLWNTSQIQLYSQKTSRCLRTFDMTEKLHQIRVTTENTLVTLSASKCIVSVYDLGGVIKFCEFKHPILSSVKKKDQKKLMSHDEENLECHPADFEALSFPRKSASKQIKVEKLRDTKGLYIKQLEENENRRRKCDRDIQKARTESDDLRRTNEEKEEKGCSLTKELEEKRKTTEELRHDIDRSKKEKDDVTEKLGNTRTNLTSKEADLSDAQAKHDAARTESDDLRRMNVEKEEKCCRLTKQLESERKTTKELNDRIKDLEGMKTELEIQQKKLKINLEEEKQKVTRAEGSRVQVVTNLKIVEERNTKLEAEVTQLKERLSAEEKIAKELQTSSLKISITKHNESMKSSLLHIRSVIDKTLPEINEHQTLQVNQLDSVHEKKYNEDLEGTTSSRGTVRTSRFLQRMQKRLSRENKSMLVEKMQQEEYGYTTDATTDNESSGYETASEFVRKRALSPGSVEKMQQEEYGYTTDATTDNESSSEYETASEFGWERALSPGSAAKIQHDEPGITTDPTTDHEADARSHVFEDTSDTDTVKGVSDEEEILDRQSKQEVCARVSVEGANLQIAETGVSLSIPPGALSEEQTIHMKIIPQPCDAQAALKFECNSAVVVELLPNNCSFQCPVSLTLPHCLQLKEEYERNSIDVLISHHDEGFKPKWELLHDAKFNLCEENCTISLNSFCWVTYEIHDKIVEAKRIKLYTAGKKMRLKDRITEVEVGFYPDLPGSGKILELNKDMHLSQRKPYVFLKTGEEPLLINLHKVVPKEWNNSQPDENPKIIPFDSVSISEERSCPFVLERSGEEIDIPLCIFKVGQKGRNEVELTIRPDVLTS